MIYKKNIALKIKGITLLLLFVGYFIGINFFPHKHIIDGEVVIHSHPFSTSENHTHSAGTVQLIQLLSVCVTKIVALSYVLSAFWILIEKQLTAKLHFDKIRLNFYQQFLRPPPALV